jgi:hypothetical protein
VEGREGQQREHGDRCLVQTAIMSIGSLLVRKTNSTKQVWQKEYDNLGSELATNPTLEATKQVLTLSYNDLSTCVRTLPSRNLVMSNCGSSNSKRGCCPMLRI